MKNLSDFFVKSHGLGNEYIVLDEDKLSIELNQKAIQHICNIHFGLGSDGILLKTYSVKADFGFRVFNPDGSEAEKSGNGLRIFGKYLFDYEYTKSRNFTVETKGGIVRIQISDLTMAGKAKTVTVEMGKANFKAREIPTLFDTQEVMDQRIKVGGKEFLVNCVSVGNPHCVILLDKLDNEELLQYGPLIENYDKFPNRINVQFVKPLSRDSAQVLIWERGAGHTMASGSSSCAVASVLKKKGLIDKNVLIKMPGGSLKIEVDDHFNILMQGEVRQIAEGTISEELKEDLANV